VSLKLTFLGGAGTVTGSKYLVENGGRRLLVDCGLFQGFKTLRLRNWAPLPAPARGISAVALTHAHIDHSGYLPLLVRQGFEGPVFCTEATRDLCAILLPDAGHLQEREADFANRRGYSKHHPALPLYTEEDAARALDLLRPTPFDSEFEIFGGARARFVRAGHILGAASLILNWQGKTVVFSGDIGRYDDPLMPDPQTPERADFLLIESTYGDRRHDLQKPEDALAYAIGRTIRRGGTAIVPAFAVGRAQSLIYYIGRLKATGRLPAGLPVFLDSPMAIDATELFRRHAGDQRLPSEELRRLGDGVECVHTGEDSKALTADPRPKVIISASGMATGGRVLHHLAHYAPDARNAIIFAGFQAGGTRGASMVGGAESIKIFGEYVPVRAEVHNLDMLSAHADRSELLRWAGAMKSPPRKTFVVHGEPTGADALRRALAETLRFDCVTPDHLYEAQLA
jgi:metallo-beta-lactamase family protein